jgi:hypothetical protein
VLALIADGVDFDCKLLRLGFASAVLKGVQRFWQAEQRPVVVEKATAQQQTGAYD